MSKRDVVALQMANKDLNQLDYLQIRNKMNSDVQRYKRKTACNMKKKKKAEFKNV